MKPVRLQEVCVGGGGRALYSANTHTQTHRAREYSTITCLVCDPLDLSEDGSEEHAQWKLSGARVLSLTHDYYYIHTHTILHRTNLLLYLSFEAVRWRTNGMSVQYCHKNAHCVFKCVNVTP